MSPFTSRKITSSRKKRQISIEQTWTATEQLTKDHSKRIRLIGFSAVCGVLVVYLIVQAVQIMRPPELRVIEPFDEQVVTKGQLVLRGSTERESELEINGESVSIDAEGQFRQEVGLQKGMNTFIFEAKKRYSQPIRITREVFYQVPVVKGSDIISAN